MLNDTICAIATSLKEAAISIIKVSGPEAFELIGKISDIKKMEANTIVYGHIFEDGEIIDEVLVSFFKGPKSFTGEDVVEINCHGGVYLTRRIFNLLISKGVRIAENGEFTKRAYLNGRIDRVDKLNLDGETYLRIIDYKTGSKKFDLNKFYN